jgi:hypothetical protein
VSRSARVPALGRQVTEARTPTRLPGVGTDLTKRRAVDLLRVAAALCPAR